MLLKHGLAGLAQPTAAGGTTRRKLVSTSADPATGMHSTSSLTMASDKVTVAFWYYPTNDTTNDFNTIWAGDAGAYQLYMGGTDAPGRRNILARMDGNNFTALTTEITSVNTSWWHVYVHFGIDHSGLSDVRIFINNAFSVGVTDAVADSEMTTAGTHWFMGDDSVTTNTDGGWIGEIFDFCVLDGTIDIADLNYSGGSWRDLTSTGLTALKYRLDGQNAADPGEDSSGNGNGFTVENGGVTTSATSLPTGANP